MLIILAFIMPPLRNAHNILKHYSNTLCNIILTTQSITHQAISNVLYKYPMPIRKCTILPQLFDSNIIKVPLYEGNGICTKMIVWNPMGHTSMHYHENEICFFQSAVPGLFQTIVMGQHVMTLPVDNQKYNYIDDTIGSHKVRNMSTVATNLSFHLYIHSDLITR